jgi:hypothetical protein
MAAESMPNGFNGVDEVLIAPKGLTVSLGLSPRQGIPPHGLSSPNACLGQYCGIRVGETYRRSVSEECGPQLLEDRPGTSAHLSPLTMEKANAIAVEDVVLEKPGKPLVTSQIVNADLSEDDIIFLEEYDEKAKSRLYHRASLSATTASTWLIGMTDRYPPRPYARFAIPGLSPRQSQHRQCKDRRPRGEPRHGRCRLQHRCCYLLRAVHSLWYVSAEN